MSYTIKSKKINPAPLCRLLHEWRGEIDGNP